jgi:hypothetical protein
MSHGRTLVRDDETTGCQPLASGTYSAHPVKVLRDIPPIAGVGGGPGDHGGWSGHRAFSARRV